MFDFELRGELEVRPVNRSRLLLAFTRVTFTTTQDAATKPRFDRVAAELTLPSAFDYRDGVASQAQIGTDLEVLTVGILRSVASHLQLAKASPTVSSWQAEEYDATGRYLAEYRREPSAAAPPRETLHKRKLRYLALVMDELVRTKLTRTLAPPKLTAAESKIVRSDGHISSIQSREQIDLELAAGSVMSTKSELDLSLKLREKATPADTAALLASTAVLPADQPYRHPSGVFDLDSAKIGDFTFDGVISALETSSAQRDGVELVASRNDEPADADDLDRGELWVAQSNRLLVALTAMLRTDSSLVERSMALVRGGSLASSAIISGLAASGSEQAQRGLVELMMDQTLSETFRRTAALGLIRAKSPAISSVRALEQLLDDPSWKQYAVFGLGTYARRLSEAGNNDEHTRIGELLLARLRAVRERREQADTLAGISNSAYAAALPAVVPYLEHTSDELRAMAVKAIRLMQDSRVDRLVADRLRTDPSREVRLAALVAARNRGATNVIADAVAERALQDENSSVRMEALRLLVRWSAELPQLRGAVDKVAKTDASEAVRKAAQVALLKR